MEDLKREIAKEALSIIATHYKTTIKEVSLAIQAGNKKLLKEVNDICEKSMELILKEVA